MPRIHRQPTAADVALYARATRAFAPLSQAALDEGLEGIAVRALPRGAYFLRAGERATDVALVAEGWLSECIVFPDGTERTKAFVFEGDAAGSLADLMGAEASCVSIMAEEAARLLCWPYANYRALCDRSPEWHRLHVALVERLFVAKARREYELLGLDAEGRYRALLDRIPGIEQRVTGRHLASYLGITPVHLSRLRRRRAQARRAGS